jgi:Domain of unknown function (DUF4389)
VRLTVTDDLKRSRLTVFFRLLLAIPHLVWWWLWSIAAVIAAVALWFVTLIRGRPAAGLYTFLASYVRYSIHLGAYLSLAANPWPMFTGRPGYPVDVEFDGPEAQRRWVTGLRLVLAIPALTLAVVFQGAGFVAWFGDAETTATWAGSTLLVAAFLGWFVCVILGRMPQGLRDLQAYGLRYLAEVAAYALVLTERYPNVDPAATPAAGREHPVWLVIDDDLRRSRLTVFFRLFLALPHFVWILLWSIAAFLVAFLTWIAALVIGRPPQVFHRFLSAYVRYATHVYAFAALTANPFPGFTGRFGSYPVDLRLPPADRQRRLMTLFRLFLAIPALLVSSALGALIFLGAFLAWFVSLALGRMPHSLREAQAYALRYSAQVSAFLFLVTARYPYSGAMHVPARS